MKDLSKISYQRSNIYHEYLKFKQMVDPLSGLLVGHCLLLFGYLVWLVNF